MMHEYCADWTEYINTKKTIKQYRQVENNQTDLKWPALDQSSLLIKLFLFVQAFSTTSHFTASYQARSAFTDLHVI